MSDDRTISDLAAHVDRLEADLAALREFGAAEDLPVVERTAKRMEGTLATLDQHVPRELLDE